MDISGPPGGRCVTARSSGVLHHKSGHQLPLALSLGKWGGGGGRVRFFLILGGDEVRNSGLPGAYHPDTDFDSGKNKGPREAAPS